ncbi:MAG: TauD/TfdA family dioxygenase [Porticoccaceae bacterium]|nr:TauD/TfdA family dioxygenase [Porticoccaceae bacterium]MDG1306793.1 TauD/TfdA family dioxygenase [Porticoccaceae bacterium]
MAYKSNMLADLEFNNDHFPTIIENDGSIETLQQAQIWVRENRKVLKQELACTGALLLRGFPVTDAVSYDAFFSAFGYDNFTYEESLSNAVRINYTDQVFSANEAPKDVEIFLHSEMAQTPIFPNIISLFCETTAITGGATILCRSDIVYQKVVAAEPQLTEKLAKWGIKYTNRMPSTDNSESAQGRGWQSTLSVKTRDQAEQKLHGLGYKWQWHADESLSAQTRALPAIKFIDNHRQVFFNQIIAAYEGWQGVKNDPSLGLCFGDDSPIPKHFLETICAIASETAYDLVWQDGDVAIVDNHLSMHGRRPYGGDRVRRVLVTLGM